MSVVSGRIWFWFFFFFCFLLLCDMFTIGFTNKHTLFYCNNIRAESLMTILLPLCRVHSKIQLSGRAHFIIVAVNLFSWKKKRKKRGKRLIINGERKRTVLRRCTRSRRIENAYSYAAARGIFKILLFTYGYYSRRRTAICSLKSNYILSLVFTTCNDDDKYH